MLRPQILSGVDIVKILQQFGFSLASQKGSHIKLLRITASGERQVLIVPNHKELDRGTTKAIFSQATKYIADADLRPHFYN